MTRVIETPGALLDVVRRVVGCFPRLCRDVLLGMHRSHELIEILRENQYLRKDEIFNVMTHFFAKKVPFTAGDEVENHARRFVRSGRIVGEGDSRPPQFTAGDVNTPPSDPSPPPHRWSCGIGRVGFWEALELSIGEVGKGFSFSGLLGFIALSVDILAEIPDLAPPLEIGRVRLLDVVEDSAGRVVLGRNGNTCVVWNNVRIEKVQIGPNIRFRFNGYHVTYVPIGTAGGQFVNVGTQPGGNAFLANYQGTRGSTFCQINAMQKSYGAKGFLPIPPIAALLLRTLNEPFMAGRRHLVSRPAPGDDEQLFRVNEVQPETAQRPLITHVMAKRMGVRPPGFQ
jgi:hypothetical protein